MAKERIPAENRPRTSNGLKLAWHKATHHRKDRHVEIEVEVEVVDGDSKKKKRRQTQTVTRRVWVRLEGTPSFRQFIRERAQAGDQQARDWLHNKTANTSKPHKGIGSTRKKKTKGGGGAPAAKTKG